MVKNPLANAGDIRDVGLIPGWGRSPEGGHGYPLQYSCLENYMDGGAWQTTVHGVARSRTQLSLHTQSNLLIQCNPYQITKGIFHRTRTKFFTICVETHKTPNSQSNVLFLKPCPPPGDLPNPGIKLMSLMSPALAGGFFTTSAELPRVNSRAGDLFPF